MQNKVFLFFIIFYSSFCFSYPLDGLLAHYSFSGNAQDLSGNGNHGVVYGATLSTDRFGNTASAYLFNGSSNYIEVADTQALRLYNTDFTMSAWIYETQRNSSYQDAILVKRGTGQQEGWFYSLTGNATGAAGKVFYNTSGGGDPYGTSTTVVPLNQWHQVTVTYTLATQTIRFYIDGTLQGTQTGIPTPNANTATALRIGADTSGSNYFFHGSIDDIFIYNRVVSPLELQTVVPECASISLFILGILFWKKCSR